LEGRYASHYVPQLVEKILENRDDRINLKGIMIGNATIDLRSDYRGLAGYAWNHTAISNEVYSFSNDGLETDQCDGAWNNFSTR
jgi:serine carboxypeptidase-like clade II